DLQFVVGEPDEVFEARGNQLALVGIRQLQVEFCSRTGRRIGIDNVAEQAGLAEALHRLFEIAVDGVLAELQAARGKNFFVGVARRSRDFQRDEFVSGDGGRFAGGLFLGCGSRNEQHQEEYEPGHPAHLDRFPAPAVDVEKFFCFTAISMKALAARLSDLSLRKTIARSRRICASASVIATSALARMSSSILERAIKPTPTSAATKRFSSSLESSSMARFGFR